MESLGKEKKLFKDTLLYMVANFGSKILLLIIYPVYTYFVLPKDLGNYDLIISTLTLVYPIIVFSINDAVFRWLIDADEKKIDDIILVGLKTSIFNLIVIDFIGIAINIIYKIPYGWIIIGIINVGSIYPVLQQIARGLKNNIIFALSGLIYAFSLIIANTLLLIILKTGVRGLLLSQIIAYLMGCIYLFATIPNLRICNFFNNVDKTLKDEMIRYSVLLIPNSSCWWVMNASDRYLIKFFVGDEANGIYALAHKFPSIINMITSVFSLAWQEQAITSFNEKDKDSYYSRIYNAYFRFLFMVCLILIPTTKWIIRYAVEQAYTSAWKYSGVLYLGSTFLALATFIGAGYLSSKETKRSMYTSMTGAVLNVVIDLLLIPFIGIEAAAISTLMGNGIVWLTRFIQSKKYFRLTVDWKCFCILFVVNILYIISVRYTSLKVDIFLTLIACCGFLFVNRELLQKIYSTTIKSLCSRKK